MSRVLPDPLVERLTRALGARGFDLVGVADTDAHDGRVAPERAIRVHAPWARSVVVVGNAGPALWSRVEGWAAARGGVEAVADPIDEFTAETVPAAVTPVLDEAGVRHRIAFPFASGSELSPSFLDLAATAALGTPSLLGVLLHPVFGPWMALRAAIVTDVALTAARPAEGFDPCPTCVERACQRACPGGVVRDPGGWDFVGCIDHRIATGDCGARCEARVACVIGREHRYGAAALAHHHGRAWRPMRAWRELTKEQP